jgi:hypothetical protein
MSANETHHYGFSLWLAYYLKVPLQQPIRGYQHGWIWWDREPGDNRGLDPNFNPSDGLVCQDENLAQSLRDDGIYAFAAGLPFTTYKNYCQQEIPERKKEILFAPTHSNVWESAQEKIEQDCKKYAGKGYSLLLGDSDKDIETLGFENIELGAGVFVPDSFQRLFNVFHSYEWMITNVVGSHICYALHCGMKVGIDVTHYEESGCFDSLDYLDKRFSGILIENTLPTYDHAPELANATPLEIAKELGWKTNAI